MTQCFGEVQFRVGACTRADLNVFTCLFPTILPRTQSADESHRGDVVSRDNIATTPADGRGRHIGFLLDHQESAPTEAVRAAFDLV